MKEFYEEYLKNNTKFKNMIQEYLENLLPNNNKNYYNGFINYLFYDDDTFLHNFKYEIYQYVDSNYITKIFKFFEDENNKLINLFLSISSDTPKTIKILSILGNKKVELLKTIILPSFQSYEKDTKTGEVIISILNSIVENMKKSQYNQNMMLSNISHEMRTPLNSVIGYLDILDKSSGLNIEDRKNITYAKNSSKLLLTLINDLLDTQKLANAKLDLIENSFWINKVVKNAVLISQVNATQKNISLIYEDNLDILNEVKGDKNRFLQILNNLLSNAVKFTPEGGKVIISAESENQKDKIKVFIKVKDSGMGIPKEKQKQLFKAFSRATNKEKGTGLGLYISKELARKMGGDIWFESEVNKGSTFFVELYFKKSNNFYDTSVLQNRNIVVLETLEASLYCDILKNQLTKSGAKVKIFNEEDQFIQFLIFNKNIDMSIIVYPNKIEKDNIDRSVIKTYKKINENTGLKNYFIAGVEENYYPKNADLFDRILHTPITLLDIIEIFTTPTSVNKNYNYLIIDDEPMNRMVLTSLIKTLDKSANIDTAKDGIEGLSKLTSNEYDIVFLDKRMPNMNGYEVLEELQRLGIKANIYLLTADGDNETVEMANKYNAGYIAKPVSLSTIQSVVSKIGK